MEQLLETWPEGLGDLREGKHLCWCKHPASGQTPQCKHLSTEISPIPSGDHAHASTAPSCLFHSAYFSLVTFLVSLGAFLLISVDEETEPERASLPSKPPHQLVWNDLKGCHFVEQCPPGELCSTGSLQFQPNIVMLP